MATFTYRCRHEPTHESARFDTTFPVGTAPPATRCPRCGSDAVRVFSPPMISHTHPGVRAAVDRAERSRSEPEVVSVLPPRDRRRPVTPPRTSNPARTRLPRP